MYQIASVLILIRIGLSSVKFKEKRYMYIVYACKSILYEDISNALPCPDISSFRTEFGLRKIFYIHSILDLSLLDIIIAKFTIVVAALAEVTS